MVLVTSLWSPRNGTLDWLGAIYWLLSLAISVPNSSHETWILARHFSDCYHWAGFGCGIELVFKIARLL